MMNTKKQSISPDEVLANFASEKTPVMVDVRRAQLFASVDKMISGARWRDHQKVNIWMQEIPEDKPIVTYCIHGQQVSQTATSLLRINGRQAYFLDGGIEAWEEAGGTLIAKEQSIKHQDKHWVTRESPKIDRIACPWLIKRFIDRNAVFHYVEAEWVEPVAAEISGQFYDIDSENTLFTHQGEQCSFDAFIKYFSIKDPALDRVAEIVRGADTSRLDLAAQSAGLVAFSLGLSSLYRNDLEMLEKGMVLYDALYSWSRHAYRESHDWVTVS